MFVLQLEILIIRRIEIFITLTNFDQYSISVTFYRCLHSASEYKSFIYRILSRPTETAKLYISEDKSCMHY